MPRGDRTGPAGQGPRTGRGAGYCSGNDSPGYANPGYGYGGRGFGRGYGRGMGFGRGRGWGRGFWGVGPVIPVYPQGAAVPTKEGERTYLEGLAKDLEAELERVKSRIKELLDDKE